MWHILVMTLQEYFTAKLNTQAKLAEALGVSQGTVNRYALRKRWPDREMILRIKDATDGAVDTSDWFTDEVQG